MLEDRFVLDNFLGSFVKQHKDILIMVGGFFVFIIIVVALVGGAINQNQESDCGVNTDLGIPTGATGSWTKKGTKEYKIAKIIFDRLTKDLGISGAAAAGVLGNMAHESGGFSLSATNAHDGGKGLIQWTGLRETQLKNFAMKRGKPWQDLGVQIDMVEHDMKNRAMWASARYHNNSLRSFGHLSDPSEAASRFYISGLEAGQGNKRDPDGTEGKRRKYAQIANKLFNTNNTGANDDKIGSLSGKSSSDSEPGDDCDYSGESGPGGDWNWPFKSIKNNKPAIGGIQLFGKVGGGRINGFHDGVDFGTYPYDGQYVLAIHGGTVYKIGHEGYTQADLGWYVCVKSNDGYYEIYQEFAFADSDRRAIKVKVGDVVKTGQPIGILSSKFHNVTHVHIGVTKKEIMAAERHAFLDDGTWKNWIEFVKKSNK